MLGLHNKQKWIHIFHVNENLERFLHVGNILSIKACFWGSWNFYNRWTLVTCRVDSNWTSDGLGFGLGDIKVKEISKCTIRLVSHQSNYIKTVLINSRFLFHFIFKEARCRWETTIFSTTLHSLSYGIR
jgi:hypothetical protein